MSFPVLVTTLPEIFSIIAKGKLIAQSMCLWLGCRLPPLITISNNSHVRMYVYIMQTLMTAVEMGHCGDRLFIMTNTIFVLVTIREDFCWLN